MKGLIFVVFIFCVVKCSPIVQKASNSVSERTYAEKQPRDVKSVPLQRYFNPLRNDHLYVTDFSVLGNAAEGYEYQGTTGYVYAVQATGTVPVYSYFLRDKVQHVYSVHNVASDTLRENEGVAWYAFPEESTERGTVGLHEYHNSLTDDTYLTTDFGKLGEGKNDWEYVGVVARIWPDEKLVEVEVAGDGSTVAVRRFYNPYTADHLLTTEQATDSHAWYGWIYQGISFYCPKSQEPGTVPLKLFYNTATKDHMASANKAMLAEHAKGWNYEGTVCYVWITEQENTVPLYRYYNSKLHDHYYTLDNSKLGTGKMGWDYQGIEAYVYSHAVEKVPEVPQDAAPGTAYVFRWYNTDLQTHFYSTDKNALPNDKVDPAADRAHAAQAAKTSSVASANSGIHHAHPTQAAPAPANNAHPAPAALHAPAHPAAAAPAAPAPAHHALETMLLETDHLPSTHHDSDDNKHSDIDPAEHEATAAAKVDISISAPLVNPVSHWLAEGEQFSIYTEDIPETTPLYVFVNHYDLDYVYSTSYNELEDFKKTRWASYKGTLGHIGYRQIDGSTPLYRYVNSKAGDHILSDKLLNNSGEYKYEGILGFIPSDKIFGPQGKELYNGLHDDFDVNLNLSPLFQFWNPRARDHWYTSDPQYDKDTRHLLGDSQLEPANPNSEMEKNLVAEWYFQGTTGYCHARQIPGTVPLFRFHNKDQGDHAYSTAEKEFSGNGWTADGIECYVYDHHVAGTVPLRRFYDARNHDHMYLSHSFDVPDTYTYQGIQCYIFPSAVVTDAPLTTRQAVIEHEDDEDDEAEAAEHHAGAHDEDDASNDEDPAEVLSHSAEAHHSDSHHAPAAHVAADAKDAHTTAHAAPAAVPTHDSHAAPANAHPAPANAHPAPAAPAAHH